MRPARWTEGFSVGHSVVIHVDASGRESNLLPRSELVAIGQCNGFPDNAPEGDYRVVSPMPCCNAGTGTHIRPLG